MKLEKIITLANLNVKEPFIAMERSLRATGCKLPVWVIPYDDTRFDLPDNCFWWENNKIIEYLNAKRTWPTLRKYQCLLEKNYQFVDCDIVFLRNPNDVLSNVDGFITSCTHWNNPQLTYNEFSLNEFKKFSTTWQINVFNSGQFASSVALYTFNDLLNILNNNIYSSFLVPEPIKNPKYPVRDQIALNFLVYYSKVAVTNLTLPPHKMQSTWAGDYKDKEFEQKYWNDKKIKPYLIHWAGIKPIGNLSIDRLFFQFLSQDEKERFIKNIEKNKLNSNFLLKIFNKIREIHKKFSS